MEMGTADRMRKSARQKLTGTRAARRATAQARKSAADATATRTRLKTRTRATSAELKRIFEVAEVKTSAAFYFRPKRNSKRWATPCGTSRQTGGICPPCQNLFSERFSKGVRAETLSPNFHVS